jgi:predicted ester cyclase
LHCGCQNATTQRTIDDPRSARAEDSLQCLVDEDDAVFVEVTLSGTHQGEWAGIPATGRRASVRIACLYEFEEDRLVCERVWFDFATILRQLGVLTS